MTEIILDAFLDSLKMLPFLFLTYLFLEYLEHKGSAKFTEILKRSGKLGPLGGAVLGCVPQCGFSVAAANLYAGEKRELFPAISLMSGELLKRKRC